MHCSTAFFSAYSGAVFSFILEKSTDYRQIAHDHACQIQLENQQPRYLARTINSGNFVHSCKYDFRKYLGSKRKRTNPMISRSRYLQPGSRGLFLNELTTRSCCIENGEIPMYQQKCSLIFTTSESFNRPKQHRAYILCSTKNAGRKSSKFLFVGLVFVIPRPY